MKLALFGDPVAHSLSPLIHRAALAAVGIDGTYEARAVDLPGFFASLDEVRYGRLDGANVTMPYKSAAFDRSDRVSERALRTGAVNTVVHREGSVRGHNTDVSGILLSWSWNDLPEDGPVLILGAGGAAAAAAVALDRRQLIVSARERAAAQDLLDRTRVVGKTAVWGSGVEGATVVNATPLGMRGERLPAPVIAEAGGLFEMAYADGTSPAERALADAGLPTAPGIDMLLAQATGSFEIWTRSPAPVDAMRAALDTEVARRYR